MHNSYPKLAALVSQFSAFNNTHVKSVSQNHKIAPRHGFDDFVK